MPTSCAAEGNTEPSESRFLPNEPAPTFCKSCEDTGEGSGKSENGAVERVTHFVPDGAHKVPEVDWFSVGDEEDLAVYS